MPPRTPLAGKEANEFTNCGPRVSLTSLEVHRSIFVSWRQTIVAHAAVTAFLTLSHLFEALSPCTFQQSTLQFFCDMETIHATNSRHTTIHRIKWSGVLGADVHYKAGLRGTLPSVMGHTRGTGRRRLMIGELRERRRSGYTQPIAEAAGRNFWPNRSYRSK
jgi:hypothetical protein